MKILNNRVEKEEDELEDIPFTKYLNWHNWMHWEGEVKNPEIGQLMNEITPLSDGKFQIPFLMPLQTC